MKKILYLLFAVIGVLIFTSSNKRNIPRVLIFTKTSGFHHESIAKGIIAIQKLVKENNFATDTTSNASFFTDNNLSKYATVIFLNTTGTLFNATEGIAFERYIQSGGGFVGIHAAADAEYEWPWYNRLIGAYFLSHPQQQTATLIINDSAHLSTKHLPLTWIRKDEWYNFKQLNNDVRVLISIDEKSYEGGKNGDHHPMAWYHDYDGGRAFYTALGHRDESYEEPLFLQHLLGGIQYAIGKNKKLNYKKAISKYPGND